MEQLKLKQETKITQHPNSNWLLETNSVTRTIFSCKDFNTCEIL